MNKMDGGWNTSRKSGNFIGYELETIKRLSRETRNFKGYADDGFGRSSQEAVL
jgi:hypothetical protein